MRMKIARLRGFHGGRIEKREKSKITFYEYRNKENRKQIQEIIIKMMKKKKKVVREP